MKTAFALLAAGFIAARSGAACAQSTAGYPPATSPYVDLEHAQELTLIGGQFHAHRDPADAGPQSGPLVGVHYEWQPGGPVELIGELARASSDRRLLNPNRAGAARELGTASRPLYMMDLDLGLNLTGGKSWHRLVPEISGGVGAVSDLRANADSGGFKFGTRFAFTLGAGLRYVPGGRWQIRGDIKDRLYSMSYPESYFTAPAGGSAVVASTQAKSFWMHNPAITLGLSYLF